MKNDYNNIRKKSVNLILILILINTILSNKSCLSTKIKIYLQKKQLFNRKYYQVN